jgi:chitin synthase
MGLNLQELKPGSKQNMLAMTGIITSTTEKNSLITLLQDMEYIHGQLFERSVESGCGAVTCLPGALTMLRFSAFRKMAKYYFADKAEQCDDLFDYGKCHLGEDRWLTHLFMIGAKERYQIQLCTGAFCKTEAVQTYQSLLKQRRRWFLGFITNEVCMLTDVRLWKRYPLLCIVRFMQNTIRTTALLFFIMVLSIITTSQKVSNLPVGFIAVSLGLNWLLMLYFGARLKRFKIWLYPIMFVINPFFNWVYMVYGIFTAGQRTWGGPRADAGAADTNTTPQQAIEHAEATGDDLNVVPETFKPAAEARHPNKVVGPVPLQPSDRLEGRFAQAERLPGGWYMHNNDSGMTLPNTLPRNPNAPHIPLHPRASFDSFVTSASANDSVYMPRRVESIMGDEDRRKYFFAQQAQREPGGAYATEPARGHVYDMEDDVHGKEGWNESVDSLAYDSSPTAYHTNQEHLHPELHSRSSSFGAPTPPGSRSPNFAPTHPSGLSTQLDPTYHDLTIPGPALNTGDHMTMVSSHTRTQRSPLGRMPLSRSNTGEEAGIELEPRSRVRELQTGDRGRHGRSVSATRDGTQRPARKLSKPRGS